MIPSMSIGRIFFAKNPWPAGHGLEVLDWTGRLDPDRGLFFDLHLKSAPYYAETGLPDDDDDEHRRGDWSSPNVWSNYHSCILSSTYWGPNEGVHVGDDDDPFDFSTLPRWEWHVDAHSNTEDHALHSMHIYLLGHDTVLRHRIRFTEARGTTFRLRWDAKIALTYVGQRQLAHSLRVEADSVRFQGFRIPDGLSAKDARDALARFTAGKTKYALKQARFVPLES